MEKNKHITDSRKFFMFFLNSWIDQNKGVNHINFWLYLTCRQGQIKISLILLAGHCTCSDQAWPDVEATHNWYLMTASIKETTYEEQGVGFKTKINLKASLKKKHAPKP